MTEQERRVLLDHFAFDGKSVAPAHYPSGRRKTRQALTAAGLLECTDGRSSVPKAYRLTDAGIAALDAAALYGVRGAQ